MRRLAMERDLNANNNLQQASGNERSEPGERQRSTTPCNSPDSLMSIGSSSRISSKFGGSGAAAPGSSRAPLRLQIIKPLEGGAAR